jgi:molecular chaperone GrpE (heat shock protein)
MFTRKSDRKAREDVQRTSASSPSAQAESVQVARASEASPAVPVGEDSVAKTARTVDAQDARTSQPGSAASEPEQKAVAPVDIAPLVAVFQSIHEELLSLRSHAAAEAEAAKTMADQAETLRHMSGRNRELEEDQVREHVLAPILRDVVLLHDEIMKTGHQLEHDKLQPADLNRIVNGMRNHTLELPARYGVTLMQDTTRNLNAKLQKVVGVRQVVSPKNNEVLEVLRQGFCWGDKVMRPEEVVVSRTTEETKQ